MNYLKIYCNLIRKAEKRGYTKKKAKELNLYVEAHHVFPVSIFGKNKRIVHLTAREHYIAHVLLERICINRYGRNHRNTKKMTNAHVIMGGRGKYRNSHLYESAKKRYSEDRTGVPMKECSKQKLREKQLGRKRPPELVEQVAQKIRGQKRTLEQRARMSRAQKGISKSTLKVKNEDFRNKFIEIVNSSLTKTEIIKKLGMKPTSRSSFVLIDKWAKYLNLDMSHLIGNAVNIGRKRSEESKRKQGMKIRGRKHTQEHNKKIKLSNCKYVYTFISPEGIVTETVFCEDFCTKNNLNSCKIREVSRGVRLHHKGWKVTRRPRIDEDK